MQPNTQQNALITNVIETMAKEQLHCFMHRYRLDPNEIIQIYTGHMPAHASYEAALRTIMQHFQTAESWDLYH